MLHEHAHEGANSPRESGWSLSCPSRRFQMTERTNQVDGILGEVVGHVRRRGRLHDRILQWSHVWNKNKRNRIFKDFYLLSMSTLIWINEIFKPLKIFNWIWITIFFTKKEFKKKRQITTSIWNKNMTVSLTLQTL